MSQQATRASKKTVKTSHFLDLNLKKRLREAVFLLLVALSSFLLLSYLSYHPSDVAWSHARSHAQIHNWAGQWGAYLADLSFYLFGYMAYSFPVWFGYAGLRSIRTVTAAYKMSGGLVLFQFLGFILSVVSSTVLLKILTPAVSFTLPVGAGGVIGDLFYSLTYKNFALHGTLLLMGILLLVGLTIGLGISWIQLLDRVSWQVASLIRWIQAKRTEARARIPVVKENTKKTTNQEKFVLKTPALKQPASTVSPKPPAQQYIAPPVQRVAQKKIVLRPGLPPLELLEDTTEVAPSGHSEEELEQLSRLLEQRLADFNVQAEVVGVYPGPVITRFEIQLAAGIKVSKISGLSKDLARSLSVVSVRVVEVIPGKPFIGLELPNPNRAIVHLREILESSEYTDAPSPLSLALGKDIAGHPAVVDLARMPHLLVAGTTGSGKSVGINSMLISLLYKASPEEVRFILIDPKMLELSVYEGIPHLLAPVVTDMKDAAYALKWCVMEMERRYRLMAALGVRNLQGFNRKIKDALQQGQEIPDPFAPKGEEGKDMVLSPLPYIVVFIDEFADMMMVVGRKVEDLIARIAQKARAAGIHLILATQRPSVDVITGLIKANIPTRMAFQVSSRIDSRTILDQQGAEQLLGHGDMLYLPPGTGIPIRVHGAFVADQEVHAVVKDWRSRGEPQYEEAITDQLGGVGDPLSFGHDGFDEGEDAEQDPLYDEATQFVLETRRVSTSSIQRRFKIGYNRAARIVEQMERAGLISAMQHNGAREVMVPASGE